MFVFFSSCHVLIRTIFENSFRSRESITSQPRETISCLNVDMCSRVATY